MSDSEKLAAYAAEKFVQRLAQLKSGSQTHLRTLACRPLDQSVRGFDLFTGLWWPVREKDRFMPRQETSWLVAKLYGAFRVPHSETASLPQVLGRCEPRDEYGRRRFRDRFDALIRSPLGSLEPHLGWALFTVAREVVRGRVSGVNWSRLLHDLSRWDKVRESWAQEYLEASEALNQPKKEEHDADRDSHDSESQSGES